MKRARFLLAAIVAIALALPATAANFLWEVKSVTNRIYLFGTVHAGKKEWYPLPAPVEEAFNDSAILVVEADVSNKEAMEKAASTGMYTPPDTLVQHVPSDDYERFRKLLPRYQIPERQVAQTKPFVAASLLVFSEWGRLGYVPNFGVDAYLIAKAKSEFKPVVEIEGVEAQMQLIDGLTDAEEKQIFEGTLKAIEMGLTSEQITGMVNAWQAGDPELILEVARRYNDLVPGAKEFEEKFIWSRHAAMLKKIEGYLNESKQRHFVAVGSLHLAGPRGLVEELKKRGYIVRQL